MKNIFSRTLLNGMEHGHATKDELLDLWFKLRTDENERKKPFVLFIKGEGMLNGEEALEYLNKKFGEIESGKKLNAFLLTALMGLSTMFPAAAKTVKQKNLTPEQKIEKLCENLPSKISIYGEDGKFNETGNAMKQYLEEAGLVGWTGKAGLRELIDAFAEKGITLTDNDGNPLQKMGGGIGRTL